MRPRVFPAEDVNETVIGNAPWYGFNEAAGIPRGRQTRRPTPSTRSPTCFNEAAGIPRGRRIMSDDRRGLSLRLQ